MKPRVLATCTRCREREASGPNAQFCRPCRKRSYRKKRRKWEWTHEQVRILRERYDGSVKGRADEIAEAIGIPGWAVRRMAAKLGLTRPHPGGRRAFTRQEDAYLKRALGRVGVERIAINLGRSLSSVVQRLKRLRVSRIHDRDGVYTCRDLASLMGVDAHTVLSWIDKDLLQARQVGGNGKTGKHKWSIEQLAVIRFLFDHPDRWWLRGVNQEWLLGLFAPYVRTEALESRCDACEQPADGLTIDIREGETYWLCGDCARLLGSFEESEEATQ